MKIKRYLVEDLSEAVRKIKAELGPNAMVLSARKTLVPAGRLGLIKKELLEVTAVAGQEQEPDSIRYAASDNGISKKTARDALDKLSKLESLGRSLLDLAKAGELGIDPRLVSMRKDLLEQDLDSRIVDEIVATLSAAAVPSDKEAVLALAGSRLSALDAPEEEGIVFLVGPRGSGKTSLVTKWAARRVVNREGPTAIVSADTTSRHSALQVKRLGAILKVPTSLVLEAGSLENALETVIRPAALVLVDMPGADPGEVTKTLSSSFSATRPDSVHLVLDASTSTSDMLVSTKAYSAVDPDCVNFTKLDLTTCFGGIWSVLWNSGLKACFLSAGPSSPDDLILATPGKLSTLPFEVLEEENASRKETA